MLPYKLTFNHTQDITGTKEWIDSLIIPENIPSLLTHYEPLTYSYQRVDKDLDGRPNHHIFTFSPKDKSQITTQRFEYIEKELDNLYGEDPSSYPKYNPDKYKEFAHLCSLKITEE